MKVLRLIGGIDPNQGGTSTAAQNSCIAAQRAGAQTTFAFPVHEDARAALSGPIDRLRREGIEVVPIPSTARFGTRRQSWALSWPLARWFFQQRHRFDLVHCHGAWQMASFLAAVTAGRSGPPLVLTPDESLTDFDLLQTPDFRTKWVKPRLRRYYFRRTGLLVMSTDLESRDSRPAGVDPAGQMTVIAHPVWDDREPMTMQPIARDAGTGTLRLGYLGRLHRKKNVDLLLRALAGMDQKITLAIAGAGPEDGRLRALADKLGIAGRVKWLGFVLDRAKEEFFRNVDVLVMPSQYECFGLAAAEAMVAGIPVVVSGNTGMAEIVRRLGGGVVIEPTVEALQSVMNDLRDSPERLATLASQTPRATQEGLSFSAHGAALLGAYQTLLSHG